VRRVRTQGHQGSGRINKASSEVTGWKKLFLTSIFQTKQVLREEKNKNYKKEEGVTRMT